MRFTTLARVRCGFIAAIWKAISPLLPLRTRKKVSIHSARATAAVLDELIAPEQLPRFLGGTKPDAECAVGRAEAVPAGTSQAMLAEMAGHVEVSSQLSNELR